MASVIFRLPAWGWRASLLLVVSTSLLSTAAAAQTVEPAHLLDAHSTNWANATECKTRSVPLSDVCTYVQENPSCSDDVKLISYLKLHYCAMAGHPHLSVGFLVFWVFVCFYGLGKAADNFFCPSLERIAAYLQLSPDVAGATLLSFGNSSPDVFTLIAAGVRLKPHSIEIDSNKIK
jgi:sodium/potassium/calcium exchanger 6